MGKTIKQRIARFCKKYPEPRQYKIQLRWTRKDGEHYQIVGDGENLVGGYYSRIYTRTVCKQMYMQHYRYDAETELMECSYAVLSCLTPKENDSRRWKYAERYFIPKGEKQVYDINGETGNYKTHNTYSTTLSDARRFLQEFIHLFVPANTFNEAFHGLTDGHPTVPPRYANSISYPWILTEWIKYNSRPRDLENGKTQQRINKMLAKQLDDNEVIKKKIEGYLKSLEMTYYYNHRFAYFDKANMVFRLFYVYNDTIKEDKRVYIDGKKFLYATPKDEKWVTNGSFTFAQFNYAIINMEDVYSLPHCEYLRRFNTSSVYKIVSIMRNFEVEQLCNMGFMNLATSVTRNEFIAAELKYYLGEPDKKKKNVCQRYHMTRKQIEVINNHNRGRVDIMKMRTLLNTNDLSSIDIESFKKYFKACQDNYMLRIFDRMTPEDKKKMFIRVANMTERNSNAMRLFYDTYNMSTRYNIDIMNIRSYEDLVRAHDAAIQIQNAEMAERQRLWAMTQAERDKELEKKMAKIDKEREKFNYEEEDFLIRLPANLAEIVNEGSALRHCVGGYTGTHASGETTILFLRKVSEPDKPFYTIEVRGPSVIQIHGFGNRWLGCNPEAIPTVARWLKKNNIYCTDQILRGTATGYRGNNTLVPMPEI